MLAGYALAGDGRLFHVPHTPRAVAGSPRAPWPPAPPMVWHDVRMTVETANNEAETLSYEAIARRLDHLDDMIHRIDQRLAFLDEHRPALDRAIGMLDAGAKMRGFLGRHGKADG